MSITAETLASGMLNDAVCSSAK